MSDPLAFLAAALDAAQRDAEAATQGPWIIRNLGRHDESAILRDTGERTPLGLPIGPGLASTLGSRGAADAQHIARHDPASVLRRIAADRKILAAYEEARAEYAADGPAWDHETETGRARTAALELVVRNLAEGWGWTEETP